MREEECLQDDLGPGGKCPRICQWFGASAQGKPYWWHDIGMPSLEILFWRPCEASSLGAIKQQVRQPQETYAGMMQPSQFASEPSVRV
eukprot:c25933_g1_i1 orf=78-341(-)